MAYAIAHPATVQTLILRGVFLCRRADVDYFFQGNAAVFAADRFAMPAPGAYLSSRHYPSELRGIGMEYGAVRALAEVDYTVASGEIVGLIGDNGAGKSTLVKITFLLMGAQSKQVLTANQRRFSVCAISIGA